MQIRAFPPHYQLVYINIGISPFSVISYVVIATRLRRNRKELQGSGFYAMENDKEAYAQFSVLLDKELCIMLTMTYFKVDLFDS